MYMLRWVGSLASYFSKTARLGIECDPKRPINIEHVKPKIVGIYFSNNVSWYLFGFVC